MCEVMGSEIVRNTGITRRSGAVSGDGCKTCSLELKSHTQLHNLRWRGSSLEAPMLLPPMHMCVCRCTRMLAHNKTDVRILTRKNV